MHSGQSRVLVDLRGVLRLQTEIVDNHAGNDVEKGRVLDMRQVHIEKLALVHCVQSVQD